MTNPHIPWPPRIGDRVGIKGSRLLGTVERIEVDGEAHRFILSIFAPVTTDAGSTYELTQAARVAARTYALTDLEPHS